VNSLNKETGSRYWKINDGYFIYPDHLFTVQSDIGQQLCNYFENCDTDLQVFLRGSMLEEVNPFEKSDIDLIILYDKPEQLLDLRIPSFGEHILDLKLIPKNSTKSDYVYNALLNCRSLQIKGEPIERKTLAADKKFAWEHWISYCPALIPNQIDTVDNRAVMQFKWLSRCFGVLSYLKDKMFTRDISECLRIARVEHVVSSEIMLELKQNLEKNQRCVSNVREVKKFLHSTFDEYFTKW
jgi:hypothetical protein